MKDLGLFNQNKKLVYYVYKKFKRGLPQDFISQHGDDLIQEGLIGLWKASERFDKSKGCKFSTYAYALIKGHMLIYTESIRRARRKEQPQILSLDAGYSLYEVIPTKGQEDVDWLFEDNRLTSVERKIVKLLYDRYNQTEIARIFGVSQVTINRRIKRIRSKLIGDFLGVDTILK